MDEQQIRQEMQKVVDLVVTDLGSIRTGRVTSALVEDIVVPAYGGQQRLKVKETASITVTDPQSLVISPWDKSIIGDLRKGILEANVGLNPSIDGEVLRIVLPPMTGEDRERYVKLLNTKLENGRVMIRQSRGEAMQDIKKAFEAKTVSEDEKFSQEKKLQAITDEFTSKIEELGKKKEVEIRQL
jgi:ribosome recycling factor